MKKIRHGGNQSRLEKTQKFFRVQKLSYTLEKEGSVTFVKEGGQIKRYLTDNKKDIQVMNCCKFVKQQCKKYEEANGSLKSKLYKSNYYDVEHTSAYIKKGKRDLAYIDVDHCYWQIAFIYKLIDEKTYLKYKDNREARLTAIGCLKRSKRIYIFKNGIMKKKKIVENPMSWVWDFVNYKAFLAMESIRKEFPVFSYHTDGVYMPVTNAKKAQKLLLNKHKLKAKIEYYTIVGREQRLVVLKNKDTAAYKRTNLNLPKSVNLEEVKLSNLNK